MASNQTSNYGLCQWEATDRVLHTDFNEDNQKIDTALKNLQTAVNSKASSSSMNSAVNGVAQDVAELETARLRIVTGSYTGTGTKGSYNAKTITFSGLNRVPELLVVRATDAMGDGLVLLRGMNTSTCNLSGTTGTGTETTVKSWTQTSVTWYGDTPRAHMNESGTTYHWFVLG